MKVTMKAEPLINDVGCLTLTEAEVQFFAETMKKK
jgi:hypothetical protein